MTSVGGKDICPKCGSKNAMSDVDFGYREYFLDCPECGYSFSNFPNNEDNEKHLDKEYGEYVKKGTVTKTIDGGRLIYEGVKEIRKS